MEVPLVQNELSPILSSIFYFLLPTSGGCSMKLFILLRAHGMLWFGFFLLSIFFFPSSFILDGT